MDLQIFFHYTRTPYVCILIIIFNFLANFALSMDSQFEACAPQSCGNGPSIRFPFWIHDEHRSYCGYPKFAVSCNNENPVLRISSDDFIVKNISYSSHSFLVANTALYEDKCPAPLHNYSLDGTPFAYNADNTNISFFYNCNIEPIDYPTYEVDCVRNVTHYSFAVFHKEALEHMNYTLDTCQLLVEVPVDMNSAVNFTGLLKMNYTDILKMGFLLNWTAPDCEKCERSGGRCGFANNKFLCFCQDKPHLRSCVDEKSWSLKAKVIVGVCTAFVSVVIMSIIFFIYFHHYKKRNAPSLMYSQNMSSTISSKEPENGSIYFKVHLFTYNELEEATDNFDSARELGDGGFGTVYYGKLQDGRTVAVKRLYENNYRRVEQFMNEVEILTRLRHKNLVSLYGCTSRHGRELLLVYEYIPNGTVADHLHGERAKPGSLPWSIRMNIAIETACALAYLHASDTIHRDVKTNNILLDNNFSVKVADFGLSRLFPNHVTHISTAPQGTPGYVDPEYHECYQLTDKSDVFSFGVVLIELISSMPAVDITRHRHEINLSNMAINKIQNRALHELVDTSLGYESDYKVRKMINAVAELAFRCLQSLKDMRPSMVEVLEVLEDIQNDGSTKGKPDVMDISKDDAALLKSGPPPASPDSVTSNIKSTTTTPNASG